MSDLPNRKNGKSKKRFCSLSSSVFDLETTGHRLSTVNPKSFLSGCLLLPKRLRETAYQCYAMGVSRRGMRD